MRSWRADTLPQKQLNNQFADAEVRAPRRITGLLLTTVWLVTLTIPFCQTVRAQERPDTLMLVREWNAATGKLIGWLPTHRIAIAFCLIGKESDPELIVNQAVDIVWTKRPNRETGTGDVHISPAPREFEGKQWLPLMRDANVVRIKNHLFLINQIIFEGSQYERATKPQSIACSAPQGDAKSFSGNCP